MRRRHRADLRSAVLTHYHKTSYEKRHEREHRLPIPLHEDPSGLQNHRYQSKENTMQKRRGGFTLIELLIVIVIIGILAAIAIPKFGKTREKAYFKAMQSDLRNLAAQQEIYYSNPANAYSYASGSSTGGAIIAALDFSPSQGVSVTVAGNTTGWVATTGHQALAAANVCSLFSGTPAGTPVGTPGVVSCLEP
jgi:type IV pilus assembly protein PilA